MKKKNILIPLLMFALVSCTNYTQDGLVLKLKEYPEHVYDYRSPIDIDDYIYCSHPYLLKTTVTHDGETKEFAGNVFWPTTKGIYNFVASANDKSVSFDVIVNSPNIIISFNDIAQVSLKNKYITYDEIKTNAGFQCNIDDYSIEVTNIKYRAFDVKLEGNQNDFVDVTTEAEVEEYYYKPLLAGEYKLNYKVTYDDKMETFSLSNYVLDSFHSINPHVYQDKDNHNGTNKVVYSNIDNDTFFLPKTASYDEASYVTLKDKLTVGKTVSVLFKGRSMPQIGLYTNPNFNSSSPFGLLSSKSGYLFTMETRKDLVRETDKYFLIGTNLLNNGVNIKEAVSGKDTFFGWDNLDNNHYYRLDVSLKRFGNGLSINYAVNELSNYGTSEEVSKVVASLDDTRGSGVSMASDFDGGYVTFYSSQLEDVTFKAIYQDFEKVGENIHIKRGWTNIYNGNTILNKTSAVRNWDNSGTKDKDHLLSVSSDSSILSLDGDYKEGTTITLDFTGKNIPNICLFADKTVDTELYGGDKGIMISAGTTDASYCSKMILTGPYRYDIGKPKDSRYIDNKTGSTNYNIVFGANDQIVQYHDCPASYNKLVDGKHYKFIITISKNVDEEYCIGLTLKDGASTLFTNIDNANPTGVRIKKEICDILDNASNIMFFGSFQASSINFSYSIAKE